MNILVVTNTWPSLSEVFVKNLVDGLLERNSSVTVLCKKSKGSRTTGYHGHGGSILYFTAKKTIVTMIHLLLVLPVFFFLKPSAFFSLWGNLAIHHDFSTLLAPLAWFQVRNERFDAIHCQFGYLGNIGLILKKAGITTGPVISSFRGSDISSYYKRKPTVYRVLKRKGDLFFPVCAEFRDRLVRLGFPEKSIRIYHSAIELKDFPFRSTNLIHDSELRIVCAGRLVEKKGFSYAIEALRHLVQKDPGYRMVIAGDGPLAEELRKTAVCEGVADHVQFTGWVDQETLRSLLEHAAVFLATNIESKSGDTDGIPNIVKEAMATGVPVVAFDHPGLQELIVHRTSGLLVPSRDVTGIVSAIEELRNDRLRKEICKNARQTIEKEYSKEAQARYLEQLIQEYSEK